MEKRDEKKNWFEDHPVKSIIAHTILVGGAVFAFAKFIMIDNTEQFYRAQLETKEAAIAQYEARIGFLENENAKLQNDIDKYLEWMQNTPGTIQYVENENQELKQELIEAKSQIDGNIETVGGYFKEYDIIDGDQAIVDEITGIVFSINNINVLNEGNLLFKIPNTSAEHSDIVEAGYTKEFAVNEKTYQFIVISIDYISNKYSAVIKEI